MRSPGSVLRVSRIFAPRALDGAHELARAGGHAREQLHEVERGALGGEHGARIALELAQGASGHDVVAVLVVPEDLHVGVELLEGAVEPLDAAEHAARRG